MVAQLNKNTYSAETLKILEATMNRSNFLLSGGAGSGKTYSLVETISGLTSQHPLARIACITYTNAATHEIENRASNDNLYVSTIHDFLWSNIKHFQQELKTSLVELINDENESLFRILSDDGTPVKVTAIDSEVKYKDYVKLRSGIISHDQIPILAHAMFSKQPKLCRILNDKYSFILVDEYQDTDPLVISILLELLSCTPRRNIVGFFGDAMQAIYEDGVGDLDAYKGEGRDKVTEIKKEQNRRNPTSVIELANQFRTDGLIQTPSDDPSAPNMNDGTPVLGSAKFLYSTNHDVQAARDYLGWDATKGQTKELNLTHNLIATKAGFQELMRIYDADKILEFAKRIKNYIRSDEPDYTFDHKTFGQVIIEIQAGKTGRTLAKVTATPGQSNYITDHPEAYNLAIATPFEILSSIYIDKDMLIDDRQAGQSMLGGGGTTRDYLVNHLFRIQKQVQLYTTGSYNEFLRTTDFKIYSHALKVELKTKIEELCLSKGNSIHEVIELAHAAGLVKKDDRLLEFIKTKKYIYDQVCALPYQEFQNLFNYIDGKTPFLTQHKTKGREYENVLVVMDNGRWRNYNFEAFFTGTAKASVLERTSKIVYVCCTRARRELAFFYPEPTVEVVKKAKLLFGNENVVNMDSA